MIETMTILEAVILGAVQGLTEFLPVSSSGHLVLLQRIFGVEEPALFFDTMLHAGTLLPVFLVFRREIGSILKKPLQPLTGFLVLGTIPAVLAALFFRDWIEGAFAPGKNLGFAFLLTALALTLSDIVSRRAPATRPEAGMGVFDALAIGVCQALAIAPGVSRSGLTLSGALCRRLDRDYAARFSFLLAIPAVLGALVLQIKDLVFAEETAGAAPMAGIGTAAFAAGTLAAALAGFFAVRLMMKIVREHSLWGFAVYTALLGALILFDGSVTGIFFAH
jgi:undecaprenyl-diphosphatase